MNRKFTIAFDINGNDNGIFAAVSASYSFAKQNPNFKIILVGPEKEILETKVAGFVNKPENIEIINNNLISLNPENIRGSLHEPTSMNIAIDLVKDKKAHAVLSSGNSGLYLAANTFKLKRLPNTSRAAFMPIMPTIFGNKWLLLDVGANIETKSEYLVEWSIIANVFAKIMLKIENPRVALVNIGTEDNKGIETIRSAHQILKSTKDLNYIGFVEPREALNSICDVGVIDGYGGNLVLKSLEGAILSFKELLKSKISKSIVRKIGYLLAKNAFKDVAETLDYRNVGAAWVIGVDGVAIKSHGGSDQKAYIGALNQIKLGLENDVLNKFKLALNEKNE